MIEKRFLGLARKGPAMPPASGSALLGLPVWTGCGEYLGRVERALLGPAGTLTAIEVRQAGRAKRWRIEAFHIREIADRVQLKGPREGFHIAPLPPPQAAAQAPQA